MRLYSTIDRYLRDCCPCRCCTPTNSRAPTFEIVVPTSLLFSFFFSKNRPCRSIEPVRLILFVPFSLFSLSVSWECSSSIDSISSIARNVQEKTILEIHGEWYGGSIRICKQRERFISRGSLCKRSRLCTSFFGRDSNSKESRNSKEKVFFPRLGMFSLLSRIFSTRPNEQFPLSSEFGLVPVLRGSRVSIQLPSGGQRDHRHSKILTEIESWGTINRNCRWEGDKLRETRVNLPFVRWFSIALQIQTRRNTIQRLLFPRFSVFFFFFEHEGFTAAAMKTTANFNHSIVLSPLFRFVLISIVFHDGFCFIFPWFSAPSTGRSTFFSFHRFVIDGHSEAQGNRSEQSPTVIVRRCSLSSHTGKRNFLCYVYIRTLSVHEQWDVWLDRTYCTYADREQRSCGDLDEANKDELRIEPEWTEFCSTLLDYRDEFY